MMPQHVAIVMDGNGRWAKERGYPRVEGHRRGLQAVRLAIRFCIEHHIPILTLFAFSSENWRRSSDEVGFLFSLLLKTLQEESQTLIEQGVRLCMIGDRQPLHPEFQETMALVEQKSADQKVLKLNLAINFGGQWDIFRAALSMLQEARENQQAPRDLTLADFQKHLSLFGDAPPDLCIRTGGVYRLSNFLLWDLAYTELYFTECRWPDFDAACFSEAIQAFQKRERRFGGVSDE